MDKFKDVKAELKRCLNFLQSKGLSNIMIIDCKMVCHFFYLSAMKRIIITIDGYSSCGKSTLAKQVAKELNYVFVDSGAMYRAVTLYFLRNNVDLTKKEELVLALEKINLSFDYNKTDGTSDMIMNGENVENYIREMAISERVSEVAAIEEVRTFTVAEQQKNTISKGIVMDGRDIGTVVFPNAELKIFLTAKPEIRVDRRYHQIIKTNPQISKEEIRKNLELRDYIDTHREISPLRKAEDAIVIDNSFMQKEEQLALVLKLAKERI